MAPPMVRKRLTGLRPQAYEHPLDAKALDKLQGHSGLETLVRKLNEWGYERILRVQLTGSNLRVTGDNFPKIHEQVHEAATILDVSKIPDIYITAGGLNAFTAGVERPILVLTSSAVDCLGEDELFFVIAHELGHVKSAHVLYSDIAEFIPVIGDIIGGMTLGFGEFFSAGLQLALLNWKRMSEFTADRAGLLACQDVNVAISAMIKIAGLPCRYYDSINTEDFIAQARDFEALDTDKLNWIAKGLSVMGQSHPWTVMRAKQFLAWIDSGEYERVLNARHDEQPVLGKRFCTQCARQLTGIETFCPGCGIRLAGQAAIAS
jgi:Peptidase family M48